MNLCFASNRDHRAGVNHGLHARRPSRPRAGFHDNVCQTSVRGNPMIRPSRRQALKLAGLLAAFHRASRRRPDDALPVAADQADRAACARRQLGHVRPHPGAEAVRAARPAGRGREPRRRRRHGGQRAGRQIGARRLHAGRGRQRHARHRAHAVRRQAALRRLQGFHADHAGGHLPDRDHDPPVGAGARTPRSSWRWPRASRASSPIRPPARATARISPWSCSAPRRAGWTWCTCPTRAARRPCRRCWPARCN